MLLSLLGSPIILSCSWFILVAEKAYIFYFIYTDYIMKNKKWALLKLGRKSKRIKDDVIESSNEFVVRTKSKKQIHVATDIYSQSETDDK